jgi:F420-non-reducing hydrogenase iron-sulfur subunit
MCSGRVDLAYFLRAFSNGLDGVFVGACHLGECNYVTHGNYHSLNMVLLGRRIIEHIGLEPDRLRINFMSGSEANLFVEGVNDFVKKVKELGPLGLGEGISKEALMKRLAEVTRLIPYIKMVKNEKLGKSLLNPEEYDRYFTKEEIDKLFSEVVSYYIDPGKCQACMRCARRCPAEAIVSAKSQIHVIDQDKCLRCGTCLEACPPRFGSVIKIVGRPVPAPLPEENRTVVRKSKGNRVLEG